jgi:hypothetical protein
VTSDDFLQQLNEWRREWRELHERMTRAETAAEYRQQMVSHQLMGLASRLDRIDSLSTADKWMSTGAIIKILLAICLPLLVLLFTGDKQAALKAARLVGG